MVYLSGADFHEICTQVWCGVKGINLLSIIPSLKIWWEKSSNLPEFLEDCHQSEMYNFEMAQHIDKQITDISPTINAL